MLLLRLSPASHRLHPFSLRLPNSAFQSPTAFTYSEQPAYLSTPTRKRYRNRSCDYRLPGGVPDVTGTGTDPEPALHTREVGTGADYSDGDDALVNAPSLDAYHDEHEHDHNHDHDHDRNQDHEYEHETYHDRNQDQDENERLPDNANDIDIENEFNDFDNSDSCSSISDSSIIDLPPPLEPNRLQLLPPSVSLNSGLSLAALDSSPVIGPLIRRTRSARFTSIRILSRSGTLSGLGPGSERDRDRELSDGYGTFASDMDSQPQGV